MLSDAWKKKGVDYMVKFKYRDSEYNLADVLIASALCSGRLEDCFSCVSCPLCSKCGEINSNELQSVFDKSLEEIASIGYDLKGKIIFLED